MPWNDQSGGQNGSGGPWSGGPQKPWGAPPKRPEDKGPDLEEMMRRLQNRVRPGGTGGGDGGFKLGRQGFFMLGALVFAGWLASGIYVVNEGEAGIVTRWGGYDRKTGPGLHIHLPEPIESASVVAVRRQRNQQVGFRGEEDRPSESLMLTGDEAIVDIDFTVIWQLNDKPENYVFQVANPDDLVLAVAESAMREVVGQSTLQRIISTDRSNVEVRTLDLMQKMLDDYQAGVQVVQVQMQKAGAPDAVIEAFNDVDRARADAESRVNEGNGAAAKMVQEAEAYRERVVREAAGEAERFNLIYDQYKRNPRVTRERLYLETMERVYGDADKIIVDGRSGVTPYLPLERLMRKEPQAGGAQ